MNRLSGKKVMVFVSVIVMLSTFFSVSALAENTVKLTGTKVEASALKKNSEGKLTQVFTGNYLLVKQSTFAIVWTAQELSSEAKEEFTKRIVNLDASLKNGIKEKIIFVTSTTFTKAQNSKTNNVYKVVGSNGKYTFTVVSGGVSHIVYGVYEYGIKEEKPEVKPTVKPTTKPEVKPTTKPTTKPEVKPTPEPEVKPTVKPEDKPATTSKPSDDKSDNIVMPTQEPINNPSGENAPIVTNNPEDGKVDSADTKVDGVDTDVEGAAKATDNPEVLGAAQTNTDQEVLAANLGNIDNTPKTGDSVPLMGGLIALIASFVVMVAVVYVKKKC